MALKIQYDFLIGSHRIHFFYLKEGGDGSEYAIFPMDSKGFHISTHPGADPHMKDAEGYSERLDLRTLRSINQEELSKEFQQRLESLFYWPKHRADIIAIPGPPGKTWVEGVEDLFRKHEIDLIEYLKLMLGYGTIYKVGYSQRKAFFETTLGRGSIIFDPRERKAGFYCPEVFPDRPLMGIPWDTIALPFLMPEPVTRWERALNNRLQLSMERYFDNHSDDIEAAFEERLQELKEFLEGFCVVRWRSDPAMCR
jgi:hypothetical protein